MPSFARLHLPHIQARRCLIVHPNGVTYCTRALDHTGRHAATYGTRRIVEAVWS